MIQIPIIFIDANTVFRRLITHVFERYFTDAIALVSDAASWPLTTLPTITPQAVLLGLGAEGLADPQVLSAIQIVLPCIPIVVLGHLDDVAYRDAAISAGAAAFVSKEEIGANLIPVLRRLTSSNESMCSV